MTELLWCAGRCKGEEIQLYVEQINIGACGVRAMRGFAPRTAMDTGENGLGAAGPPAARRCCLPPSDRRARDQFAAGTEDEKSRRGLGCVSSKLIKGAEGLSSPQ